MLLLSNRATKSHHFYQIFTKFINYLIDKIISNLNKSSAYIHSFIQQTFIELHKFWTLEMNKTAMDPAFKFMIELGSFQENWCLKINEDVLLWRFR